MPLRIAIIGAGPAGLSAAISLSQVLPSASTDIQIYEQATALREIGTGINLQRNTWRMLDSLNVSKDIHPEGIFRSADGHAMQMRNGRTGELLSSLGQGDTPPAHLHARALRSVLQKALLANVKCKIHLNHRLERVTGNQHQSQETQSKTLTLHFSNSHTTTVDLLIGADGVRSAVRQYAFPEHRLFYTGKTAYRGLIPSEKLLRISGFPDAVTFWHGPRDWVYTCNLKHGLYELTCMAGVPDNAEGRVSWGERASREEFMRPWKDFGPMVQEILSHATDIQRFALFAGPLMERIVLGGNVALIGDASHPLSGAFGKYPNHKLTISFVLILRPDGAGAAFAFEDSYVLSRAVSWALSKGIPLSQGLDLYNRVRTPHYRAMYDILAEFKKSDEEMDKLDLSFDEGVDHTVRDKWGDGFAWLYGYDVQKVWDEAVREEDEKMAQCATAHL
ncbi:FAD/NAD(P)-binding domain-containing protein [Aspergillus unguis]